jgi:hypothetical protein
MNLNSQEVDQIHNDRKAGDSDHAKAHLVFNLFIFDPVSEHEEKHVYLQ